MLLLNGYATLDFYTGVTVTSRNGAKNERMIKPFSLFLSVFATLKSSIITLLASYKLKFVEGHSFLVHFHLHQTYPCRYVPDTGAFLENPCFMV